MFDLDDLQAAKEITVQLTHPATGEKLEGLTVTCHAPSTLNYRSAMMKVAKKYADKDGKQFLDMNDAEIEQALTKTTKSVIDTVGAAVTSCALAMNGERLTLEQFKKLIEKEEYFWVVQQVKDELDSGKFVIKA